MIKQDVLLAIFPRNSLQQQLISKYQICESLLSSTNIMYYLKENLKGKLGFPQIFLILSNTHNPKRNHVLVREITFGPDADACSLVQ